MELMKQIDPRLEAEEMTWDAEGRWWSSIYNDYASVTAGMDKPDEAVLVDCTLREGEETPNTYMPLKTKIQLAHDIAEVGFRELEIGYCGVIDEHYQLMKELKKENLPVKFVSHTRAYGQEDEWKREIDRNLEAGVDILSMVCMCSEVATATTPWLPKEKVAQRVVDCVSYAKEQGAIVSLSFADQGRTRLDHIVNIFRAAVDAGVDRLLVTDGIGALSPEVVAFLTRLMRDIGGSRAAVATHLHDGLGLATANTLRAVACGAKYVDVVPLGLGDGAGLAAAEEVAFGLESLYKIKTNLRLELLPALCEKVAAAIGVKVPDNKAIVGKNQFLHTIDAHIACGLRGAWYAWEHLVPEKIGREREIQFGYAKLRRGKSGALYALAQTMGYNPELRQMDEILERVAQIHASRPFATTEEVREIILYVMQKI